MAAAALACAPVFWPRPEAVSGAEPWRRDVATRAAAPFPRAVGDAVVQAAPTRIVAASVLSAEVLLALVSPERIAGVVFLAADPRYSEVAEQAATLPVVGQTPEHLIAARPDLVILDEFTSGEVPALLDSVGVPTVRTRPVRDFDAVADNVRLLGWCCGADDAAEELVAGMRARLRELQDRGQELGVWRLMNLNGDLDTYGSGSLLDAAIRVAGARNLPAEHGVGGYQKLDVETVLGWRPDALVIGVEPGQDRPVADWLRQHPGLRLLPCVEQQRIVRLPHSLLGSTSHRAVEIAARIQQQLLSWGSR